MENHTKKTDKERLAEKTGKLTDENQRCFLGVLEALSFAQNIQNQAESVKEKANSGVYENPD
jgi:hypothetical protein